MTQKSVALYTDGEKDLWQQVEQTIRQEFDSEQAREGEIAAQAFAAYLGTSGPLEVDKECPWCNEYVNQLSRHIRQNHDSEELEGITNV